MRIEYFQLIDRIEHVDRDRLRLVASAQVPAETTIFEGHFPGYPVMPGVLLIESMAQTAGFLLLWRKGFAAMPFLVGMRNVKLRSFVAPSSLLEVEAEIDHEGSGYAYVKTSIHCDGVLVSNAVLALRFLPFPVPQVRAYVEDIARRIGLPEWQSS